MNLSKLFEQSALYLVGNIVRRVAGFLMIPLYTRLLSPADYGIIELVELSIMVSTITFGVSAASDAMVRIYHEQTTDTERNEVVSTSIWLVSVLSLVLWLVALLFSSQISSLVLSSAAKGNLIGLGFAAMLFSNLVEIGLVYQRLMQRARFFVVFSLIQLLVSIGLNVYFLGVVKMGAYGFILGKLVYTLAGCAVILPLILFEVGVRFSKVSARRLIAFGSPLILTSISFFIIHFVDRFFVRYYVGLGEVGVYSLAYRFAFLITFLVGEPFGSAWNVSLYSLAGRAGWQEQFSRVARTLLFCLFFAGMGLTLFSGDILRLAAAPSYAAAAGLIPGLAFGYVFREVGDFFRGILFIHKRVLAFSRITMTCAALNVALDFALIKPFGVQGAMLATLLTWAVYMVVCWVMANRECAIPRLVHAFATLSALSVAMYGVVLWTNSFPIAIRLLVNLALLGSGLFLVWWTDYFPEPELDTLKRYLFERWNGFAQLRLKPVTRP